MFRYLKRKAYKRLAIGGAVQVGRDVHIGLMSRVWAPVGLEIGDDVYIGKHCTIEVNGSIGSGTMVANSVGIVGRNDHDVRAVGSSVRESPWIGDAGSRYRHDAVVIGEDVWIGFGAVVLAPVRIGRGAVVGAGAVVAKDVEPYEIVVGNPARVVGFRFDEADRREHERLLNGLQDLP